MGFVVNSFKHVNIEQLKKKDFSSNKNVQILLFVYFLLHIYIFFNLFVLSIFRDNKIDNRNEEHKFRSVNIIFPIYKMYTELN